MQSGWLKRSNNLQQHRVIMWIFNEFFFILTLFAFFVPEKAEITVSPMDTEAAVGEDVAMSCDISSGRCAWYHLPIGASVHEVVYQERFLYNGYKESKRFRVMETNHGMCNLRIENVQIADAGLFTCMEASGSQASETAELIVFAQYPSNQSCSAKIICSPSCNNLELSCNMMSYGSIKPLMEWRDAGENLVNSTVDKAASVVQVIGDLSKHLVYTCYVKYHNESLASKFYWSYSASVKLEYKPNVTTEESCVKEYIFEPTSAMIIASSIAACFLITTTIALSLLWKAYCREPKTPRIHPPQLTNAPAVTDGSLRPMLDAGEKNGDHCKRIVAYKPPHITANYDLLNEKETLTSKQ